MNPRLKLLIPPLLAGGVLLVAAAGYMIVEGWSFGDSLYEAANVVSTLGLEEVHDMSRAGEAWTFVVIIFGVATIAVAFGIMTQTIVSGELRRVMGRRTLQSKINQLDRHFIVCGYGRMGRMVTSHFRQHGIKTVVVDHEPQVTAKAEEDGVLYVLGDASEEETLVQAGIMRASGLVALLSEDSANVFVTLTARGLRSDLNIAARAEQLSTQPKLERAGANRVICPAVIGAIRVANIMMRPNVADFIEVTAKGVELEVDEYVVSAASPLRDKTLDESKLRRKAEVLVVAIKRVGGQTVFSPGPNEKMCEGDTLILIGPDGAASRMQKLES
ncbi:MAG: NAD-binding protein [Phycisphaerae bacterium]|nr:NAD-binding protein [Phycisphaerae bacterium]